MEKITAYIPYCDYNPEWFYLAYEALLKQTFKDFKVIIYDYSKDINNSKKIIEIINNNKTNLKIDYFFDSEVDNFISAIKRIHNKINTKYTIRIDADDIVDIECLEQLYINAEKLKSKLLIPDYLSFSEDDILPCYISGKIRKLTCHALFDTETLKKVKFMPNQTFRDGTAVIYYFKHNKIKINYLGQSLFNHRLHGESLTTDMYLVKKTDKKIRDYYNELYKL